MHDAGQGHGKDILAALADWVFAETATHRFWLEVVEANPRARHVYRSLGWTEEGVVREAFEDQGVRGSFVQMSILKSEWRKGARPPLVFNQVTVPARDLERSIAFYETLGFRPIVKSPHYARFEIGDGQSTFSLPLGETEGAANGPHLYFECIDLDARIAELEAKGIEFDAPPVDQTWLWREAWLSDPAGNRLCLYWAGENRRFPPWRLKG